MAIQYKTYMFIVYMYIYILTVYVKSPFLCFCIRKFLRCPNFIGWYNVRREEANQKLRILHLETLYKAVCIHTCHVHVYHIIPHLM